MGFLLFILMGLLCFGLVMPSHWPSWSWWSWLLSISMLSCLQSTFYIPLLVLKARKFSILFTLGSIFIILRYDWMTEHLTQKPMNFRFCSFSVLWGPVSHMKHLFSKERLPFTLTYFGSLFITLYFALNVCLIASNRTLIVFFQVKSTLLTALFAVIQVIALIWYVVSYLPGGQTGLMFLTKAAAKTLPV